MATYLASLKKASDYQVQKSEKHPQAIESHIIQVLAFGQIWTVRKRWLSVGRGSYEWVYDPKNDKAPAALLARDTVTLSGSNVSDLLAMSIDWVRILTSGDAYGQSSFHITVCGQYVTVLSLYEEIRGWDGSGGDPVAQFILSDYSDNTDSWKAYLRRQRLQTDRAKLVHDYGLTVPQAEAFLSSGNTRWKWEVADQLKGYLYMGIASSVWQGLADTGSHGQFESLAKRAGLGKDLFPVSHPRRTAYAQLLANMTK